jgi:hypothetical protein
MAVAGRPIRSAPPLMMMMVTTEWIDLPAASAVVPSVFSE